MTDTPGKDVPAGSRPLDGREILLGVSGGIAAYKSADLASKRRQCAGLTGAQRRHVDDRKRLGHVAHLRLPTT